MTCFTFFALSFCCFFSYLWLEVKLVWWRKWANIIGVNIKINLQWNQKNLKRVRNYITFIEHLISCHVSHSDISEQLLLIIISLFIDLGVCFFAFPAVMRELYYYSNMFSVITWDEFLTKLEILSLFFFKKKRNSVICYRLIVFAL